MNKYAIFMGNSNLRLEFGGEYQNFEEKYLLNNVIENLSKRKDFSRPQKGLRFENDLMV